MTKRLQFLIQISAMCGAKAAARAVDVKMDSMPSSSHARRCGGLQGLRTDGCLDVALQRAMASGRRSHTATPTATRKTRGQAAASYSKVEPDKAAQPAQPVTPEQSAAVQQVRAMDATDSSPAAEDSAGRSSSQDRTYSEQVQGGLLHMSRLLLSMALWGQALRRSYLMQHRVQCA